MSAAETYADLGSEFEGSAIVGMEYEVRGISGGLSEPAKFNPAFFSLGEDGYIILHVQHRSVRFDPADKKDLTGDRVRVQILDVLEGTIVDESVVAAALKHQREINEEGRRREEAERGIHRLPFSGQSDDAEFDLAVAHANGGHADMPVLGCPNCELADEDPEEVVLLRQHEAGIHADGPRPGCVRCQEEIDAEQAGD